MYPTCSCLLHLAFHSGRIKDSHIVAAVKQLFDPDINQPDTRKTTTLAGVLSSCGLVCYTDKVAEQFHNLKTLQQMFKKNQILCETTLKEVGLVAHQIFILQEKMEELGLFSFENK